MGTKETLARRTDPGSSHAAAAAVRPNRVTVRDRVLAVMLHADRGMTHDEIIAAYRRAAHQLGWPAASDSSIRTRCKELQRAGHVERVHLGEGRSRFGRAAVLWRALPVQSSETNEHEQETGAADVR